MSAPLDGEVEVAVDLASVVNNSAPVAEPPAAPVAALGSQPALGGPIVEPLPADPVGPGLPAWPGNKPSLSLQTSADTGTPVAAPPAERSSPVAATTTFPDLNSLFEVDDDPEVSGPQLTTARATSALTSAPTADDDEPTAVLRFAKDTRAKDTSLRAPSRSASARPSLPAPPPMSVPPVRPPTAAPPPGPAGASSGFDRPSFSPVDVSGSGIAAGVPLASATATLLAPLAAPPMGSSSVPPAPPLSAPPPGSFAGGLAAARMGSTSLGIAPPANPPLPPPVGGSLLPPSGLGAPGLSAPSSSLLPPPAPAPHFGGTLLSVPPPSNAGVVSATHSLAADSVTVTSSRRLESRVVNFVDRIGEAAFSPRVLLAIPVVIASLLLVGWLVFGGPSTGQLTITVAGPNNEAIGNVQVFVDGQQRCDSSPCRIDDLAPGTHLIRAAAEGYAGTADQALVVQAGDALAQNFALAAVKRSSVVETAPAVVQSPPLAAAEPTAVKLEASATVPVEPIDGDGSDVAESAAPTPAKRAASSPATRAAAAATPATAKPKKTGGATLNINSTPASTIVLNGRPLGRTPQNGVSVAAGKHTVVFVNPQRGRKTVKVQVSAGGNKNVSVRF